MHLRPFYVSTGQIGTDQVGVVELTFVRLARAFTGSFVERTPGTHGKPSTAFHVVVVEVNVVRWLGARCFQVDELRI